MNEDYGLSEWDDDYAGAEEIDDSPISDGEYRVRITDAYMGSTQSGNPKFVVEMQILQGKDSKRFNGRKLWHNQVISSAKSLPYLKRDLGTCGLELGKLSSLPEESKKLIGVELKVKKTVNKDGYDRIYINERVGYLAPKQETVTEPNRDDGWSGPPPGEGEDDLPF